MKRIIVTVALVAVVGCLGVTLLVRAQDRAAAKFEYAIVKWDGPDRLFYKLPNRFELVHMEKAGVKIDRDAQAEEFYLAVACNKMAQDGWEPVNLDSRRVVFRRAAGK
jgi:hypothetical protein